MAALFEAGPFEYHATGEPIALTWQTLTAYGAATQAVSEPWEYRALISMSRAYVDGLTKGADEFCAPPSEWIID